MGSETLSQSEIDQLLRRGARTPLYSKVVQARPDVQVYDFRRPSRVSKDKLRTIEAMYERLVKSLEGWLISRVRGQVELRLLGIESLSFGEFIFSLSNPCASYLFDIADSGSQQGVVDIGQDFAFYLVDRFFGGGSAPSTSMERSLTPIERLAVRGLAERIVALLGEIWGDHVKLEMELAGFESFPEILQAVNREDPVLVASIDVRAGDLQSLVLVCLPFGVLDKFFSGTTRRINAVAGSERERELSRELTETSLRATPVPVSARLPEFHLPLRELASLHVGSVLATGIRRDADVHLYVGDQHRYSGVAGRVGSSLAVRIAELVHEVPE
ncbi:MAG TPA: FliM/FliN family flagellar motor switch protein [Gemmatimonadaceae bacterium]|nr:FliM/FliN family flagellar motor switch protein [Gemmatimonadaceae bacterium]